MSTALPNFKLVDLKVSCQRCSLSELCLPRGLSEAEMEKLDQVVKRGRPISRGEHLFHGGAEGGSLYAVRSGSFKIYSTTKSGEEQVLGFYLPGELLGFDGFDGSEHNCSAVALETSSACEIQGEELEGLCGEIHGLHRQIRSLIGKEITQDQNMLILLGKKNAEEKLATFLLSISQRYGERGYSKTEFNLPMSRQDIGNYLSLAVETVSRTLANLQEKGLVNVHRRNIVLPDLDGIKELAPDCRG